MSFTEATTAFYDELGAYYPDTPGGEAPRALGPVPGYERAVREMSRMLSEVGIRHVLVGALAANAYRTRPRTTEDFAFLVGDEAFETHAGGYVTMKVPVIEFDGMCGSGAAHRGSARD